MVVELVASKAGRLVEWTAVTMVEKKVYPLVAQWELEMAAMSAAM